MNFFRSLYNSLFNVEWLRQRFLFPGAAWAYFFLLSLILSAFALIPVAVGVPAALREVRSALETKVPDFKAEIKSGELALTGVPNPYTVSTVEGDKSLTLYVDTVATTTYDAEELVQSPNGSVMLVTKDSLEIYEAAERRSQSFLWKDIGDLVFTKATLDTYFDTLTSPVIVVVVGLFVLILTYIGFIIAKLLSILMVTLIVLVACRIAGRGWRFGQLFTIGLYAFTLPSLIALVLWLVGLPVSSMHFLALLAFMLAVVFTKDRVAPEPIVPIEKEVDKKLDLDLEK